MSLSTTTERNYAANQIGTAMSLAGLAHDHPMRQELEERAVIVGGRDPAVRVNGKSLDDAIAELKRDPRYAGTFEPTPKTVDHRDMRKLSENFTAIAEGKIVVK